MCSQNFGEGNWVQYLSACWSDSYGHIDLCKCSCADASPIRHTLTSTRRCFSWSAARLPACRPAFFHRHRIGLLHVQLCSLRRNLSRSYTLSAAYWISLVMWWFFCWLVLWLLLHAAFIHSLIPTVPVLLLLICYKVAYMGEPTKFWFGFARLTLSQ